MNQKLVVLIGSVAAFHLAVGGLFLAGGCAQEDPPMPPGIYVPKHGNALENRTQDSVSDKAVGPESTLEVQESKKVEPQNQTASVVTPAQSVPAAPAPSADKEVKVNAGTSYKVVKGDSLWRLSRKFKVTIEDLATFNGLAANAKLYIGQTLMIPAEGQKVTSASPKAKKFVRAKRSVRSKAVVKKASKGKKTAIKSKKSVRRATAALPADGVYVVKSGDNFTVIARRFGLRIADIQRANPNVNSSRLKIGQKLQLPTEKPAAFDAAKKTTAETADNKGVVLDPATGSGSTASTDVKSDSKAASAENADMNKLLDDASAPAADKNNTQNAASTAEKTEAPAAEKSAEGAAEGKKADPIDAALNNTSENEEVFITLDDGSKAVRLVKDTTVADFCKKYGIKDEEKFNNMNPTLPFDGKLKKGLLVKMPMP